MNLLFKSDSSAMWSTVVVTASLLAFVTGCYRQEESYYTELGCEPKVGGNGCPQSYDCSILSKRIPGKCYFKGKEYKEGQRVDQGCGADCVCKKQYFDNQTEFVCAIVECAHHLKPNPPGCYNVREHGKCCGTGEVVCLSNLTAEQKAERPTCRYKDKEYQVGMQFYPEDSCLECICQPGFNGSLVEPYCKKIACSLELHNGNSISRGCIPVYTQKTCCPIGWRCPVKSDKAIPAALKKPSPKTPNSDLQCQFGEVKMQVGDKLSASGKWRDADCECRVPPHPVCIQDTAAYGNN